MGEGWRWRNEATNLLHILSLQSAAMDQGVHLPRAEAQRIIDENQGREVSETFLAESVREWIGQRPFEVHWLWRKTPTP